MTEHGADTELILLRKSVINTCNGCLICEEGDKERKGICSVQDDMQSIYPRLLEADGLALGTPVYFELLSGLLKNFMDRTCPIWPKLEGKSIVGIAVAEEGIGKAIDNLKTYASVCNMHWVGYVTTLAKTPGQASKNKDIEKRIKQLAEKFIGTLEQSI